MAMRSDTTGYGTMARGLHWISALLILGLVPVGFAMQAADGALRTGLYRAHVAIGLLALVLTILRAVWWLAIDRKPASDPAAGWRNKAAKVVHAGFYVILLALGVSGIGMMALTGAGPLLFESGIAPGPDTFADVPPRALHGLAGRILIALFLLHVGAALYHHFVLRDGLILRMTRRRTPRAT